jgi:hypothetical protein
VHERAELRTDRLDPLQRRLDQLDRPNLPAPNEPGKLTGGAQQQLVHDARA